MTKMTGQDRVLTALKRKQPDMVPTWDFVDSRVMAAILPGASPQEFADYMDVDAVWFDDRLHYWKYELVDEAKGIIREPFGGLAQLTEFDWATPIHPAIESPEELSSYILPDPDLPERYEYARDLVKRFKGKKAIIASIADVWGLGREHLLGVVNYFRCLIQKPDLIVRTNEILLDYQLRYMKNCIDLGAEIFMVLSDWAMTRGPMASPGHLARFAAAPLKKMVDYAHSRGVPIVKHTDGNLWQIMDILVDTGIDALNPIDPTAGMDMGEAKAVVGDKVCLCGNIDTAYVLASGTAEEVRMATRECIRKGGRDGGFICMSSNTIHPGVKPENYVAMINAIREFGRYPLEDHLENLVVPGSGKWI